MDGLKKRVDYLNEKGPADTGPFKNFMYTLIIRGLHPM